MVVAGGLDNFADLAVRIAQTRMGLLYCESSNLCAKIRLGNTKCWL